MKAFVLSAVSIVLVGIFFCPMAMSAPSMPADVQMVQPDPSLPKELAAFWGKWEAGGGGQNFIIVEKIGEEKANLYLHRSGGGDAPTGWFRYEANVIKERGKYKLWYIAPLGKYELTLKGETLDWSGPLVNLRLKQIP